MSDEILQNQNNNLNNDEKKSVGPLIAIIIILAVFIAGAFYFWGEAKQKQNVSPEVVGESYEEVIIDELAIEGDQNSNGDASQTELELEGSVNVETSI